LVAALVGLAAIAATATQASIEFEQADAQRAPAAFSVLTYNIHGLPAWIARDDPEARIPRLLEKAERFDVVLLQEDFAYQDVVDGSHRHETLVRGNGPRMRGPGFGGSGLTLLTNLKLLEAAVSAPYESCHGWLSAASDCFGNKGFSMQRVALPGGAEIDIWNTHLEAGAGEPDHAVRREQLERLADAIESHSAGRSVDIGGDFNLNWDHERDRGMLVSWSERLGLALAVATPAETWGARLDYLFFRTGPDTILELADSGMVCDFVGPRGTPLSDHPALFATFDVR
jgi:endonuclease/exonuclease/phosphatase family metal-dependent hydrolase